MKKYIIKGPRGYYAIDDRGDYLWASKYWATEMTLRDAIAVVASYKRQRDYKIVPA